MVHNIKNLMQDPILGDRRSGQAQYRENMTITATAHKKSVNKFDFLISLK